MQLDDRQECSDDYIHDRLQSMGCDRMKETKKCMTSYVDREKEFFLFHDPSSAKLLLFRYLVATTSLSPHCFVS